MFYAHIYEKEQLLGVNLCFKKECENGQLIITKFEFVLQIKEMLRAAFAVDVLISIQWQCLVISLFNFAAHGFHLGLICIVKGVVSV